MTSLNIELLAKAVDAKFVMLFCKLGKNHHVTDFTRLREPLCGLSQNCFSVG